MKERILCAATKYKTEYSEVVVCGFRHSDCIDVIKGLTRGTMLEMLSSEPIETKIKREHQGFMTNKNRFVDRKEAYRIAKAANQLLLKPKEDDKDEILTSEDLY